MLSFKSVGAPFLQAGEAEPNMLQLLNVFVPGGWVPYVRRPSNPTTALWSGHHLCSFRDGETEAPKDESNVVK